MELHGRLRSASLQRCPTTQRGLSRFALYSLDKIVLKTIARFYDVSLLVFSLYMKDS